MIFMNDTMKQRRKEAAMTLEEIKSWKTELGLTNEMLARASGVPLGTVQKLILNFLNI